MIETQLLVGSNGVFGSAYTSISQGNSRIIEISRENFSEFFGTKLDITSMQTATSEFITKHKISRVIYSAQHSDYKDPSVTNVKKLFEVNDLFLLAVLMSSREMDCDVTYFSSGSVYSESFENLSEISSIKMPSSCNPYVASKIAGEYFASSILHPSKLLILRPFFMYGLKQKEHTLVPSLITRIRLGNEVTLQGESGLVFNPIYSSDAAQLVFSLQKQNISGVFNLSGSYITNIRELSEIIGSQLKVRPKFRIISSTPSRLVGDNAKLLEFAEPQQHTTLAQAVSAII
jgi:nucleoside-diphosphate-sugar epimerase